MKDRLAIIDWRLSPAIPRWMPRGAYITAMSQLYHGELATLALCRDLRAVIDAPDMRRGLDTQIADETRHVAFYRRYLERLGGIAPVEPSVAGLFSGDLKWKGSPLGTIAAVHILLEGEGLRLQRNYSRWFRCPLLRQIHASIAPEEARHHAFGHRVLSEGLPAVTHEERIAIYRWLRNIWRGCAGAAQDELPGFVRQSLGRRWIEARWRPHQDALIRVGLVSEDDAMAA